MTASNALFHREIIRHELVLRTLTVTEVTRPAPDMVRVTIAGDDLAGFESNGAADHIKIFFPHEDGTIHTRGEGDPAKVISRDFTPLMTADGSAMNLDFYTHVNPGPAASWALATQPGDTIKIGGPRGSRGLPEGADSYLIMADETALPSVMRWIADIDSATPITLLATVHGDGAWVSDYVGATSNVTVQIVDPAVDTVLAALDAAAPIGEKTFVFTAGNAATLISVRRRLRREWNLPAAQVAVSGYWRTGVVAWDHHAPIDPTDPGDEE